MNRILFLIDQVPPSRSANGICADKIMNVLAHNNQVYCIGTNNNTQKRPYKYYRIGNGKRQQTDFISKIKKNVSGIITSIVMLPLFPAISKKRANKYFEKSAEIIDANAINIVVGVSFPGETLIACKMLKEKYGNAIKVFIYPLDVAIEGNRSKNRFIHRLSCYFAKKNLREQIRTCDYTIVLENAAPLYKKYYPDFIEKMLFAGIPMIENLEVHDSRKHFEKDISIMYAGNISSDMYNPIPVLNMIDNEAKTLDLKISFHLYGHADKKLLNKLETNFKNIKFINHGWVDEEELNKGLQDADACLNIAKTVTKTIPSKFFKYMCLFKPIIHFYYDDDDPCLDYLNKYSYAINVKSGEKREIMILEELQKFIITKIDLENTFDTCTPSYTARLIEGEK